MLSITSTNSKPLTISKKKCSLCSKEYTRKTSLDRHIILCKILHSSKREQQCEAEEASDLPTYKQLFKMVQELGIKYATLENKMEEIQKWTQQQKKKIDINQWINTHLIPEQLFDDWTKSIILSDEDIDLLLSDMPLQKVITSILHNNLVVNSTSIITNKKIIFPIICFEQKAHLFYIYKKDIWIKHSPEDFVLLVKRIHSKLFSGLTQWKKRNEDKIRDDEIWSNLYEKVLSKLTSINFSQDSTILTKIRTGLYHLIKLDLKTQIEYEF